MAEAMDYVTGEFAGPGHDITKLRDAGVDPQAASAEWDGELNSMWPAILRVAGHYVEASEIDNATIAHLVEEY